MHKSKRNLLVVNPETLARHVTFDRRIPPSGFITQCHGFAAFDGPPSMGITFSYRMNASMPFSLDLTCLINKSRKSLAGKMSMRVQSPADRLDRNGSTVHHLEHSN